MTEWLFRRSEPNLFRKIIVAIFVVAQILDGLLTYHDLNTWGLNIEANPLVAWGISMMGIGLGLGAAKIIASVSGLFLYRHRFHNLVALLAAIYLIFAVMPWAYLFLTI